MTTTNASTTKKYCANSGKWCEFANLQGFCTLTACCKRVIYNNHTWYMNDHAIKRWNRHKESGEMTVEEAIQWFEENPFMHENHEPFKMAIKALKQQLKAEQDEPQCETCINYGVEFTDDDSFDTCLANECHYEPQTGTISFTYTEEEWNEIQDWKERASDDKG